VQATFRLVEHHGAVGVHYFVRDLHSAVRGQTVHEDGVRRRASHKLLVHLVGREYLISFRLLVLVTHAGPGISIDRVCPVHSLVRVVKDLDAGPGLLCNILRIGNDLRIRCVAARRGDANPRAQSGRGQQQRMSHVIAIAHVGET
jgi:hypothetical protein